MVSKFADISKGPSDLLNDDFTSKVSLKIKKAAGPVSVTVDSTRSSAGAISSKVGSKFTVAGLSFDKAQLEAGGGQTLETSLKPCPGVKVSFKGGKGADLGIDYKKGNAMTTAKLDLKEFSKLSTSAALGISGGIVVGGNATYSMKSSSLSAYNVGASYTKGAMFASVVTDDKLSSANLSLLYKVSPVLSVASSTFHNATKSVSLDAVGAEYSASFGDVKAKVSGEGVVSASLVKEIAPKVTLTASGSMVKTDTSTFKYGLGIVM